MSELDRAKVASYYQIRWTTWFYWEDGIVSIMKTRNHINLYIGKFTKKRKEKKRCILCLITVPLLPIVTLLNFLTKKKKVFLL